MTQDTYRKALEAANAEMEHLQAEQERIEKRIAQLRQIVGSLLPLVIEGEKGQAFRDATPYIEPSSGKLGLTDAIREVLKAFDEPLTALDVKDGLERLNLDLSEYQNVMAAIHTILKRLCQQGELEESVKDGKSAYRLKRGLAQALGVKRASWMEAMRNAGKIDSGKTEPPPALPRLPKGKTKK
jgi:hypothetical protein